jgi:hypothetical protein
MVTGFVDCNVHLRPCIPLNCVCFLAKGDPWRFTQVHMVPKSPTGWRFALDYREFNENSESHACPISNIRKMLARIGEHRPRHLFWTGQVGTIKFRWRPLGTAT